MDLTTLRRPDPDPHALFDLPALARLGVLHAELQQTWVGLVGGQVSEEEHVLLRVLVDMLPDYLFVKDADCRFVLANKALAEGLGIGDPSRLIGKSDLDLYPLQAAEGFLEDERQILATGAAIVDREEHHRDASGHDRWFSTTKVALRDIDGRIVGIVGTARDITAKKRGQFWHEAHSRILELMAASAEVESVLANLVAAVEKQLDGTVGSIQQVDPQARRLGAAVGPHLPPALLDLANGTAIGEGIGSCGTAAFRRCAVHVADVAADPLWQDAHEIVEEVGLRSAWSTPILAGDGEALGTLALYSPEARLPSTDEQRLIEEAARLAGIAIAKSRSQARVHHMAHHDALTGLPNRTLLHDRLAQAISYAARYGGAVTVAFIDLDNFKQVNDSMGHAAGDELLRVVAGRMVQCVRSSDTVVRLGGDEFVIVLQGRTASPSDMLVTLRRICGTVAEPVDLEGQLHQVTCSMGLAVFPQDGDTADALLANADTAMYRAKETGRDNFQFYTAELNARVHERLSLQESLRDALDRHEFSLAYQPQVDLATGRVVGVEALLRWQHPDLGELEPGRFIAAAEESGLMLPIGEWVLRTACRQLKRWLAAGHSPIRLAVNVSPRQFQSRDFVERIRRVLNESELPENSLELEFTETALMRDGDQAFATMTGLRTLGVSLAIDDFGTGYSNLGVLKSLPLSRLKIDRTLIQEAGAAGRGSVAASLIALGHAFGLEVTAEGVETEGQLAFLRAQGCDQMQGYLVARPMTPEALEARLALQDEPDVIVATA